MSKELKLRTEAHSLAIKLARDFIKNTKFYKDKNIKTYIKNKKGKNTTEFTKEFLPHYNIYYPIAYDKLKYNIND